MRRDSNLYMMNYDIEFGREQNVNFYTETFDNIHAPEELARKVNGMNMGKNSKKVNFVVRKFGYVAAAAALIAVSSNVATYAATGETWVHKAVISINGEDKEVEVKESTDEQGNDVYKIEQYDENGNGWSVESDIPLDDDKIQINEDENGINVEFKEDLFADDEAGTQNGGQVDDTQE